MEYSLNTLRLIKLFILFIVLIIGPTNELYSQNYRQKGDKEWKEGKIKQAVNSYDAIKDIQKDPEYLIKRGKGNFRLNFLKKAIRDFTQAKKSGSKDPELFNYMAQVRQHLLEYEEAAFFYKQYIIEVGEKDPRAYRALIELKNCIYSATHIKDESVAFINEFGDDVNTYYDEIYPIQSPRLGNTFYYTSNSNKLDMRGYSVAMDKNGEWLEMKKFGLGINTAHDDYIMDISPDGKSMLFIRNESGQNKNKIYVSTFDATEEQHIIELPDYLIFGAQDLQIVNRNTIAFASKDLGGYGGYDIFTINYQNKIWSDPVNVGEGVNSEYDERSPLITTNSDYIYFSSNRPYCYGGYDIYYYNFLSIKKQAENMGQPINSPGDDLQFRLSNDGQQVILSSNRKTGKGAFDIYMMYMKDPKPLPAKDSEQLEYVADYLKKINGPLSHLDKLKQRIPEKEVSDKDEAENNPLEETTISKEESPIANVMVSKEVKTESQTTKTNKAEKEKETASKSNDKDKETKVNPQRNKEEEQIENEQKEKETKVAITEELPKTSNETDLRYTLLYEDRQDLKNVINKPKLEALIELLTENPEYKTHLIAFTDHTEPGLPEFMQYNTLKRANLIADMLLEGGVASENIVIESMCDNYPIARKEVAGQPNTDFKPYNKRIDIEVRDASDAILIDQEIADMKIPGYAMDRKFQLYSQIREEVYYSVEIASAESIFKNAVLRLYEDIYIRKESADEDNKYYIGLYNTYMDAVNLQKDLLNSSAPYAKVVAFYNGSRIDSRKLSSLIDDYPQLKAYADQDEN